MRRFLSLLATLVFYLSAAIPVVLAVEDSAFSVSIIGTLVAESPYNGQGTLVLDWQIHTNKDGLTLRYAQGLRLAYDNTILQLMKWDGADVIADSVLGKNFSPTSQTGSIGAFNTDFILFAASNASGELGYLNYLLGNPFDAYECPQGIDIPLVQVRFAFRTGKTIDDLSASSIRCMTTNELRETSQSTAVLLNTDENDLTSYVYLKHEGGVAMGGDTMNAPTIMYPHSAAGYGNESELAIGATGPNESGMPTNIVGSDEQNTQIPMPDKPPLSEQPVLSELAPASTEIPEQNQLPAISGPSATNARESDLLWALVALSMVISIVALAAVLRAKKSAQSIRNRR